MKACGVARLGMLAVGLGIGAAVAHSPVAAADTSTDWLSSIDSLPSGAVPATPSDLNLAISFDGYPLVSDGNANAYTLPGEFDLAIAYGDEARATAEGGYGDYAFADSTGSYGAAAIAGDPTTGATGNNFDFASANGNGTEAFAGNTYDLSPDTTGSSFDFASTSGGDGVLPDLEPSDSAIAGDNGSGDIATAVGPDVESLAGVTTGATPVNFDVASAIANDTALTEASAGGGGTTLGGSNDVAFVADPWGTVGSTADAGLGYNYDLAGVFGDALNATATSANYMVDILPSF